MGDGPEAGGLAGVKEKASQGVMVRADITGTACAGKTLEEVIFIFRMSSEVYRVDM